MTVVPPVRLAIMNWLDFILIDCPNDGISAGIDESQAGRDEQNVARVLTDAFQAATTATANAAVNWG